MPDLTETIQAIGPIGSLCSILGLVLTILLLTKVGRISRRFLFQARFPALKKKVASHRSTLSTLLNTYPDSSTDLAIELQKCHATLKSLKRKIGLAQRSNISSLLKQIKRLPPPSAPPQKDAIYQVYLDLVLLEEELQNLSEDIKWRARE